METVIIFAAILIVPALFTVLAYSLGPSFRSPLKDDERAMAVTGTLPSYTMHPSAASSAPSKPVAQRLKRYPTLHVIDQLRGSGSPAFANDLHASQLERRARQLTDDYWSEGVWVTGAVSPAQLNAVVTRLERERQELIDKVEVVRLQESSLPSAITPMSQQA